MMATIGQHKDSGPKLELSEDETRRLEEQTSRLVPEFKANKFQEESRQAILYMHLISHKSKSCP